jgi:2-polyprenyl-3-methyl-5-hydroxy-6-metoxy-1,4-benzoquinol methylase
MSFNDNKVDINDKERFQKYHDTFYQDLHGWRDYELTSEGFAEWYYDCLPTEKKARILDIGCGDGKFLYFLQRRGYTSIEGLELSSRQAEEARKHVECPIHVVEDSAAFLLDHPSTYQTITMNDVLEHVPKDETVSLLRGVLKALEPDGNIVVNVPQVSGFTSIFCRYNDFTHEAIFTEMSLKQVLSLAGFTDIRFMRQKWPLKWTPRHLAYRLARLLWYGMLKLIYTIESPGERHPRSFQVRLVASANRPRH